MLWDAELQKLKQASSDVSGSVRGSVSTLNFNISQSLFPAHPPLSVSAQTFSRATQRVLSPGDSCASMV